MMASLLGLLHSYVNQDPNGDFTSERWSCSSPTLCNIQYSSVFNNSVATNAILNDRPLMATSRLVTLDHGQLFHTRFVPLLNIGRTQKASLLASENGLNMPLSV